jgi:choline kinase
MSNLPIKKGVVLAAGFGSRMNPHGLGRPKVLLDFGGQPLILHVIRALVRAGIKDIGVVVGHRGEVVERTLEIPGNFNPNLEYIYNANFQGGNATSVLAARDWLEEEPFILCMGDHVLDGRLVSRLLKMSTVHETLCIDRIPRHHIDLDEATKVRTDPNGFIKRIGKGLSEWDAIDTGVFLLTERFLENAEALTNQRGVGLGISDVIQNIVDSRERFATCDITGLFWADLDTREDIRSILSEGVEQSLDTMASSQDV